MAQAGAVAADTKPIQEGGESISQQGRKSLSAEQQNFRGSISDDNANVGDSVNSLQKNVFKEACGSP